MVDDSAASEDKSINPRQKLGYLRVQLTSLLQQDWKPFTDVNEVITDYLLLLNKIPLKCYGSEERVDLNILENLQAKLQDEFDKAKEKYYEVQFSNLSAHRKRAMMLRDLQRVLESKIEIPDDFRKWIEQRLNEEDWNDILKAADLKQDILKKRAKNNGESVQFPEQTADSEQIKVDDPGLVIDRFTLYSKGLDVAQMEMEENSDVCAHTPQTLLGVERIVSQLERRCLLKGDDDIKVEETSQDVQRSTPDDVYELLKQKEEAVLKPVKAGQSGKSKTFISIEKVDETSQDVHRSTPDDGDELPKQKEEAGLKLVKAGQSGKSKTSNRFKKAINKILNSGSKQTKVPK